MNWATQTRLSCHRVCYCVICFPTGRSSNPKDQETSTGGFAVHVMLGVDVNRVWKDVSVMSPQLEFTHWYARDNVTQLIAPDRLEDPTHREVEERIRTSLCLPPNPSAHLGGVFPQCRVCWQTCHWSRESIYGEETPHRGWRTLDTAKPSRPC